MRYLGPGLTRVEAAVRDLGHPSVLVRVRAAEALGEAASGSHGEAIRALLPLLGDPSPAVRYAAALALGRIGAADALSPLVTMLERDDEPMPRQAAAVALGAIGLPEAAEPLRRALGSSMPELRFQAATALPHVDPDGAKAPLRRALADADAEVRAAAAAALGDLADDEARDPLAQLTRTDSSVEVRAEAACALARLSDSRCTPPLLQMLRTRDYAALAAEHLFRCPDPAAADALTQVLGSWFASPLVKVWAAATLARLDRPGAEAQLGRFVRSKKTTVRGLTIQLLGQLDVPWSRNILQKLAKPPVPRDWQPWQEEIRAALGRDGSA